MLDAMHARETAAPGRFLPSWKRKAVMEEPARGFRESELACLARDGTPRIIHAVLKQDLFAPGKASYREQGDSWEMPARMQLALVSRFCQACREQIAKKDSAPNLAGGTVMAVTTGSVFAGALGAAGYAAGIAISAAVSMAVAVQRSSSIRRNLSLARELIGCGLLRSSDAAAMLNELLEENKELCQSVNPKG
jgi:hypothetical protein